MHLIESSEAVAEGVFGIVGVAEGVFVAEAVFGIVGVTEEVAQTSNSSPGVPDAVTDGVGCGEKV
tara:strand:- start:229 stop:423 length:195 start_codon:yes stop_codon:yes gene_type:complete